MRKKVSIITVVYNHVEVTLDLLASIEQQEYRLLEVIVVDNGSTEDTSILKSRYPEIKLIRSEKNLGFAGGNNLGIQAAKGHYLFFLNNDTVVPKGTISSLLKNFNQQSSAGMICPLIAYYDSPTTLQYAGASEINPWTGRNRAIGYKQEMEKSAKLTKTSFAHGAALFTKKALVSEIGLMPEDYFLYYEEMDWSMRFRKAGYQIFVDHNVHVLHKESISTGKGSPLKLYYQTRNRILFMKRHYSAMENIAFYSFLCFFTIPKKLISLTFRGQFNLLNAFFRGIFWHIKRGLKKKVRVQPQNTNHSISINQHSTI